MSSSSPDLAPAFCRQAYLRPCRPGKGRGSAWRLRARQAAKEPTRCRRHCRAAILQDSLEASVVSDGIASISERQRSGVARRSGVGRGVAAMARRLGLRLVGADALSIRRRRRGKGWSYLRPDGRVIRDRALIDRLTRLAVPPAYEEVIYAT